MLLLLPIANSFSFSSSFLLLLLLLLLLHLLLLLLLLLFYYHCFSVFFLGIFLAVWFLLFVVLFSFPLVVAVKVLIDPSDRSHSSRGWPIQLLLVLLLLLLMLLLLLGGGLWTSGRKETADIDSIAIHWM